MAASNVNVVVVTGNLTRDPELRHTPGGTAVCKLRIAVNTRRESCDGHREGERHGRAAPRPAARGLRHRPGGPGVCKLRIAVNTRRKSSDGNWEDKPNYFDVTVW